MVFGYFRKILGACRGATAIEYALIASLIIGVAIVAMGSWTDSIIGFFNAVSGHMETASSAT